MSLIKRLALIPLLASLTLPVYAEKFPKDFTKPEKEKIEAELLKTERVSCGVFELLPNKDGSPYASTSPFEEEQYQALFKGHYKADSKEHDWEYWHATRSSMKRAYNDCEAFIKYGKKVIKIRYEAQKKEDKENAKNAKNKEAMIKSTLK